MINLYTTTYLEPDVKRMRELSYCLVQNRLNKKIDEVITIAENCEGHVIVAERPTFNKIFEVVNQISGDDDLNIIANSDIYFDEMSICYMDEYLKPGMCFALTRWNMVDGKPVFFDRADSQDTFVFRGKIKNIDAPFHIGIPGCDNKLCYEIQKAGYEITNPSLTIRSYHVHNDTNRSWYGMSPVPPPYLLINPISL